MIKIKNTIKTISYDLNTAQSERLIPVSGDLFSGADFGRKPVKKPVVVLTSPFACARCGQFFTDLVRVGRPQRFCSAECRHEEGVQQRSGWKISARSEREKRPTHCQRCGVSLGASSVGAGRFRRYCSTSCLKKSREPPSCPDLLDTVCHAREK